MANAAAVQSQPFTASAIQVSVERGALLKALSHVQSVVERRGTIPILANVKLEAVKSKEGDMLRLTATDMDIAVTDEVAAHIGVAGSTTVPAHTLYDIVRKLPEGSIEMHKTADAAKVTMKAGAANFSLACLAVEDFPVMSEGDLGHEFTLKATDLAALIDKTRFAVSTEETRYNLNGVYLHVAKHNGAEVLRCVATDGHRLARIEVALPAGASGMPGVIIPRKTIAELRKLMDEGVAQVGISLSEAKIRFAVGNAVLLSKLIDGAFPDYERVIPQNNEKILEVETKALIDAVDLVSVIASEKSRGVKIAIEPGKLTLSANSPDHNANRTLEVNYSAEALETGFNARYLLDMLSQIEGDSVQFVLAESTSPALVRDLGDVGALYVVMPMRV